MKKKILCFLLMICLIFPFAATSLTACGDKDKDTTTTETPVTPAPTTPSTPAHTCTAATEWTTDDTHHWHKCTSETCTLVLDKAEHDFELTSETAATIDADGLKIETCKTCPKTKETVIPKLVQTKDEMIAVLESAVREQNYSGNIQETSYYEKTSDDSMISAAETPEKTTTYLVRKADGTMVHYTVNHNNPDGFVGEYIEDATYIKKVDTDNIAYYLSANKTTYVLEGNTAETIGSNYTKNYTIDNINSNLDYLLNMHDEESMVYTLRETLSFYVNMYQSILASKGAVFSYDKEDIAVEVTVTYEDGIYTAVGTIVLAEEDVVYQGNPTVKIKDFKVEFTVEYKTNLVVRNDSKFIYTVENAGVPTQFYIINNYAYTTELAETHFTKIATVSDAEDYSGSTFSHQETLTVYVNNVLYSKTTIEFGTAINPTLNNIINELVEAIGDYSAISTRIENEDAYVPAEDVIIDDYYGKSAYITVNPNDGYTLIMTSYVVVEQNYKYELIRTNKVELVETNSGTYTIDKMGPNPDYDPIYNPSVPETVAYEDYMIVNNAEISDSELTFEVTEEAYYVELTYYIDLSGLL